jgi:outer membrane biosynthesis protein TonB
MKPNFPWSVAQRALALGLTIMLCGALQLLAQTAQNTQSSSNTQGQQQQAQPTTSPQSGSQQQAVPVQKPSQTLDVDPSKGPLQPVPSTTPEEQQTAPNAQQPVNAPTPQPQTQKTQAPAPAPQGVAVAGEAKTNGGPASEPAGTAIAPAKQHQMRSLIIKIGAIGAGAAALGAIYALTRGTPSHPPSAAVGATQAH